MEPACLVIGRGAGIGGHVAKRFASGGYHPVLCRRSDETGLRNRVESIEGSGGSASGFLLNTTAPEMLEETIAEVEAKIGASRSWFLNSAPRSGTGPSGHFL
jgi:NAD(P)-dependent dehydrogenase (short-subunit alcohol dehydrogenase family)